MKEIRVYLVVIDFDFEISPKSCSDEEFMEEAEKQGNVYTLAGFEESFNNDDFNQSNSIIRIINPN